MCVECLGICTCDLKYQWGCLSLKLKLSRNGTYFMEQDVSLPYLQEPTAGLPILNQLTEFNNFIPFSTQHIPTQDTPLHVTEHVVFRPNTSGLGVCGAHIL